MELKLWWNGEDMVIAESPEEATAILVEESGCSEEEAIGEGWKEWNKPTLTIYYDRDVEQTFTPDKWAEKCGKGVLCSINY